MNTSNIILLVFGAIIIPIAIGIMVAGGTMLWIDAAITDEEGYLTTKTTYFDSDTSTILTEPADIEVGPVGTLSGGDIVSFKVMPASDEGGSALGILTLFAPNEESGTDLSVVVGAKVPWLFEAGIGLLASGIIAMLIGGISVFFALRHSVSQTPLWKNISKKAI